MAHLGLLGIGIIFIIIGIILFIIGWVLSARTPVVNPVLNNNFAVVNNNVGVVQTGTTGWEWFLIIAGVILFIIGLIMVMLSFYWRPAVVVPPMGPPFPVAQPLPPHDHSTVVHNYMPPQLQTPLPQAGPVYSPPMSQTIDMPPQNIYIHQAPPNVVFGGPPEPPRAMALPPVAPPVRVSYGRPAPAPASTTVRQLTPDQYDADPISRTSYYQPPPSRTAAHLPGYGPTTGVRTPGLQAVTTTVDPPNQYVRFA